MRNFGSRAAPLCALRMSCPCSVVITQTGRGYVCFKDSNSHRKGIKCRNLVSHSASPHFSFDCLRKYLSVVVLGLPTWIYRKVSGLEMFLISVHKENHRKSSSCWFNQHLENLGFVATLRYHW